MHEPKRSLPALPLLVLLALSISGCMQVETRIKLNADGSGTITERMNFSQRLLELAEKEKGDLQLDTLLTREAVEKRVANMGKGAKLVSHEIRNGEMGSRESVAVYQIPYLGDFTYVSPFLSGAPGHLKIGLSPMQAYGWRGHWPGGLTVGFSNQRYKPKVAPKTPVKKPDPKKGDGPPPPPAPSTLQSYRDLAPVFRDMFGGLKFRVTFEAYCGISKTWGLAHRDRAGATREVDLINVSDKDLDAYGYDFFGNEEIMLEVLQWRLGEVKKGRHFLTSHLRGMANNKTLPVFHQGWRGSLGIRPSKPLFDRIFAGKVLDWTGTRNVDIKKRGKQPAKFEWIGWRPKKKGKDGKTKSTK